MPQLSEAIDYLQLLLDVAMKQLQLRQLKTVMLNKYCYHCFKQSNYEKLVKLVSDEEELLVCPECGQKELHTWDWLHIFMNLF